MVRQAGRHGGAAAAANRVALYGGNLVGRHSAVGECNEWHALWGGRIPGEAGGV